MPTDSPTEYEVVYRIDGQTADNPHHAAEQTAWNLVHHGWAERGVYEVRPADGGPGVQIDLSGELDDEPLPAKREPGTLADVARALHVSDFDPDHPCPVLVFDSGRYRLLVTDDNAQPGCTFVVGIYPNDPYDLSSDPLHAADAITAADAVHLVHAFIEHVAH